MKTAFPYYGGKQLIAPEVWQRFGDPSYFFEPFVGAGGVLLSRPTAPQREFIGDSYCLVTNFYRAAKLADSAELAELTHWTPSQLDLEARDRWLTEQRERLHDRLASDPVWYDLRCAAWYAWKNSVRIARNGPALILNRFGGVCRKRQNLMEYFAALKERLSNVTIYYGDWTRLTNSAERNCKDRDGAVFLDPPYLYRTGRSKGIYAVDSPDVAHWVRRWAVARAKTHPKLRIALCGWAGEHDMPPEWEELRWRTRLGAKECVWFSPSCLKPEKEGRAL